MRVLTSLTYYRPYTSGLTIYAERLAEALTARGHEVAVLCMQHEKDLLLNEKLNNVSVIRAPFLFRLSKGFISVSFLYLAIKELKKSDIVHLHLPQFEGAVLALLAFLFKKPLIVTYHCDIILPKGLFNRFAQSAVWLMNKITASVAKKIITYTEDFAGNSPFLKNFIKKVEVVLPPVVLPASSQKDSETVVEKAKLSGAEPVVGMAARLAAEKGVEVLVDAVKLLKAHFPKIKVLFAGPYQDVVGESRYRDRIMPQIEQLEKENAWTFLGSLKPAEMSAFYPLIDVLVVPSLNSTESFGLVQIEAMKMGVPVVSSNLPGVRQPVLISGIGKVVAIGDAKELANAISKIVVEKMDFKARAVEISKMFEPEATAMRYEEIYLRVLEGY